MIAVGFEGSAKYNSTSGTIFEGTIVNSQENYRGL